MKILEILENLKFLLSRAWKASKGYFLVTVLNSIFNAFLPLINIVGLGAVWQSLKKKSIGKGKEVCKHFTNGGTTVRKSPGVVV